MAKCPICNSRKGKRRCLIEDTLICSPCCGATRSADGCTGCKYYQAPIRRYSEVPAFSTSEMSDDLELMGYGNSVEGALCAFDIENGKSLYDNDAIRIIELLIDLYYFKDLQLNDESPFVLKGLDYVLQSIQEDLSEVDTEVIVKILGVIRFVAKRRTNRGKEYMDVIHQYVGQRVGSGMRVVPNILGSK